VGHGGMVSGKLKGFGFARVGPWISDAQACLVPGSSGDLWLERGQDSGMKGSMAPVS
jgi:hypothetical protein